MDQGELFSLSFCQDIPWVLACGGSKGEIAIWDVSESKKVEEHFKPSLVKGTYDEADYDIDNKDHEPVPEGEDDGYEDMEDDDEEDKKKKKKSKKSKK
jgi:hypothetical protein